MNLIESIPSKRIFLFIYSFILGLFLALSFEPFKVPFLSLLSVGVFFLLNDYVVLKYRNYYKIFFYNGVFFGIGFFLLSMYWVSNSIIELDPELYYIAPIIFIFFPVCLSIFFGVMQVINASYWNNSNSKIFYFSATWIIFEILRSFLFTGLPWNLIGYSWSWSLHFSQFVSFAGIYGLGLLTVFSAVCFFSFVFYNKNKFYFLSSILILILLYLYGFYRINSNQIVYSENELRIVHTYFNQNDKWKKNSIEQTASMGSPNLLSVFPETSLGYGYDVPKNWIVGYIRKDNNNFFNSIKYMGFNYDKKILVPFGEYFPLSNLINSILPEKLLKNDLTEGNSHQIFPENISPLICYEAIFPNFVRKSISDDTELLVNISNDGWFGNFSGPKQHFVHAQFRSIELGIPLVRSSNKGISGLIAPTGQILNTVNSRKITYLDVKIPKKTKATVYKKFGNLFTYFLIVLFFIIGYAIQSKKK